MIRCTFGALLVLLLPPILGVAGAATAPVRYTVLGRLPGPDARIVSFSAQSEAERKAFPAGQADGSGPLRIRYSGNTELTILNERGSNAIGEESLPQISFDEVKISPDKKTIGWLASYLICAQSYPCDTGLMIFRAERKLVTIFPRHGVLFGWAFVDGSQRIATYSAYPHLDVIGACALYDGATGRHLTDYKPDGRRPDWVKKVGQDDGCP